MRKSDDQCAEPGIDRLGDLLTAVSGGDQAAFAELYDLTSARIHGLIVSVLRDRELAAEVTQEVYVEIWRTSTRYRPSLGTVRAWMHTIARRRAVDRVRAVSSERRRDHTWHAQEGPEAAGDLVGDSVVDRSEASRLRRGLADLSEPQQVAVGLAYFGGLSQSQIAERLDVPLGTVKTRIRDGLTKLRGTLREVEG